MLDISFYTTNGHAPHSVELAEDVCQWLAKSDFSKLGKSVTRKIKVEGDLNKPIK